EEASDQDAAVGGVDDFVAAAGGAIGIIGRTDDGLGRIFEPGVDLVAVQGPVAAGEEVDACTQHIFDGFDLQSFAAGQVFALGHYKVYPLFLNKSWEEFFDGLAARP